MLARLVTLASALLPSVPPPPAWARLPQWPSVQKAHLRIEPDCQVCGTRRRLEVHHVVPVHDDPTLELVATNLLTLCRAHHYTFGHLCLWTSHNPQVREHCRVWAALIAARPMKGGSL